MKKLRIRGGNPLRGVVPVSGAKNAALPALAAALLTDQDVVLRRLPAVMDVLTMKRLLRSIGAEVEDRSDGAARVRAARIDDPSAPYELVKTMRASSLVLGPLLARAGRARVSLPGGCAIGARPINLHVAGLEALGARVVQEAGYIEARADDGLRGATYVFPRISVTGAEDLMMAAVLARGETVIENAAREPEVVDLARLLNKMGARIEGAGTSRVVVHGVSRLGGAEHAVIPDRIEAGTYLIAGALRGDPLTVRGAEPEHLEALLSKLAQAGVEVSRGPAGELTLAAPARLRAVDVATEEHPGFPTDMQAQWTALMLFAEGSSHVVETIFENRFMHVSELLRMGAEIEVVGNRATIRGGRRVSGAAVMASDLRASACLVLAALAAENETVIDRVYHLDRGYENLAEKLRAVGADIESFND